MNPTEAEIAQAMGVDLTTEETATAGEAAEQAEAAESTESAARETEDAGETALGDTEGAAVQDAEERRRQAHGRRQREEAQRREQVEQMVQKRVDGVFAALFAGQNDPYTGKPIDSERAYMEYARRMQQQSAQQKLQSAGIDPAVIEQLVDARVQPVVQDAQLRQVQAAAQAAQAYNRQAQEAIEAAVANIRTAYGADVQTIDDIVAMPTGKRFSELVAKGVGIEDSYRLANWDALAQRSAQAAYSRGAEAALGTGHLKGQSGSQAAPYTATAEERRIYREFNPDATDAEIDAAYAREKKEK